MNEFNNEIEKQNNNNITTKQVLIIICLILSIGIVLKVAHYSYNYYKNQKTNKDTTITDKDIETENKYAILSKEYERKYEPIGYLNGYILAMNNIYKNGIAQKNGEENFKYGIIDINNNVKVDFKYYQNYIDNNRFILSNENENLVLNKDLKRVNNGFEVIIDQDNDTKQKLTVIKMNEKYGLINQDDKIVVEPIYDEIEIDSETCLSIAKKDGKNYVFDNNASLIINDVKIDTLKNSNDGDEYEVYNQNKNFIVIKSNNKYKVYSIKAKTYSNEYDHIVLRSEYYGYNKDGKIYINDYNHNTISKFNKEYHNYDIITKDIISVQSKTCKSDEFKQYYDLYNKNGKQITSCVSIYDNYYNDDNYYIQQKNGIVHVYDTKKELFKIKIPKNRSLNKNEYGNFEIDSTHKHNKIYNKEGKQILKSCKTSYQVSNHLYTCVRSAKNKSLVDINGKKIAEKTYNSITSKSKPFILVKDNNGKYGLIDTNGNVILNEKYDYIHLDKNFVTIQLNDKFYFKLIEYVNKETYDKYLQNDNNINS